MRRSARSGRAASLSHGVVIEASILARLLGIRLLRLNARIDMVPIDADSMVPVDADPMVGSVGRYSIAPIVEPSALPVRPGTPADPAGTLSDAAELLQHAERTLREVRRERAASRW